MVSSVPERRSARNARVEEGVVRSAMAERKVS